MSGGVTSSLRAEVDRLLDTVHKELGVRRADLIGRIGPELRRHWGIGDGDRMESVREVVIARFDDAIERVVDAEWQEAMRGYYNVSADHSLWTKRFEQRLDVLPAPLGGRSRSSIRRKAGRVRPGLLAALAGPVDGAAPVVVGRFRQVVAALNNPDAMVGAAVRGFLGVTVLVPGTRAGGFHFAHPRRAGVWLCVFTSAERYGRYHRASGAPWPENPLRTSGAWLVRELRREAPGAGILVDPRPDTSATLSETLCLPAEILNAVTLEE